MSRKISKYITEFDKVIYHQDSTNEHNEITIAKITYIPNLPLIGGNFGLHSMINSVYANLAKECNLSIDQSNNGIVVICKTERSSSDKLDWELADKIAISKCNRRAFKFVMKLTEVLRDKLKSVLYKLANINTKFNDLRDMELSYECKLANICGI